MPSRVFGDSRIDVEAAAPFEASDLTETRDQLNVPMVILRQSCKPVFMEVSTISHYSLSANSCSQPETFAW